MGRTGRIAHCILTLALIYGCSTDMPSAEGTATIRFAIGEMALRSFHCDEEALNDINILIFDSDGDLHKSVYQTDMSKEIHAALPVDRSFDIFACANLGHAVTVSGIHETLGLDYRLTSPDHFRNGVPMSLSIQGLKILKDTSLTLALERLAAKICLRIDRSGLDPDTDIDVRKIMVGNCPGKAALFKESRITRQEDILEAYCLRDEADILDIGNVSEEISLHILENIQERDPAFATYMEIELGYRSDSLYTLERNLIYRFHIGSEDRPYEVQRNCMYHITICPTGDGISEDGWRIEKSGLHTFVQDIVLSEEDIGLYYHGDTEGLHAEVFPNHAYIKDLKWESSDISVAEVSQDGTVTATGEGSCMISCHSTDGSGVIAECLVNSCFAPPHFIQHPQDGYINGRIGDSFHLWCDVFPPDTPFDIGEEYLEDDKENGIYDYVIDDDGHGVTITLTGAGSGMIYMEAGAPVNDAALFFIEVDSP